MKRKKTRKTKKATSRRPSAKKKVKAKPRKRRLKESEQIEETMNLHEKVADLQNQLASLWHFAERSEERLEDIEIHINLLTRLFTTLCIEKFGMRVGVLKRMIKRIEKEAIRESQIHHLESLYKLTHQPDKKQRPSSKEDPWDDIS